MTAYYWFEYWSAQYANVTLRMDGHDVTTFTQEGGGVVNCQFRTDSQWGRFQIEDQGDGTVAFGSLFHPGIHLRMDGRGVTAFTQEGSGTVNCQFGVGPWEKFRLEDQGDGTIAIASVAFDNVYLRMDGRDVTSFAPGGSGTVNCQFGVGPWEKFKVVRGGIS